MIPNRFRDASNLLFVTDYPTAKTAQQLADELLFERGVQSYLWAAMGGSMRKVINSTFVIGCVSFVLVAILLSGCAQTTAPGPNPSQQPAGGSATPQAAPMQPPSYPPPSPGASASQFEQPPVVNISEFLPVALQSGNGYYLGQQVPTNGAMGQYSIIANADVFGSNAGTYPVEVSTC